MTGNGKSAVPAGALIMSGGIAITFVPLLSVGTGQASSAKVKYGKSFMSFHVDDFVGKDRTTLVDAVDAVKDRSSKKPIMLYLSLQSITEKDNSLFSAIIRAAKRGVLSGVTRFTGLAQTHPSGGTGRASMPPLRRCPAFSTLRQS